MMEQVYKEAIEQIRNLEEAKRLIESTIYFDSILGRPENENHRNLLAIINYSLELEDAIKVNAIFDRVDLVSRDVEKLERITKLGVIITKYIRYEKGL